MKALFAVLALTLSTIASADYTCEFTLSKNHKVVGEAVVRLGEVELVAGHFADLLKEKSTKTEQKDVIIVGIMKSWKGEESAEVRLVRTHYIQDKQNTWNQLATVTVNGAASGSIEVEDMKLDVSCSI